MAWDPYDQNKAAPFFDPEWMFGVLDGFDVVVGNPPYVRIQTLKQQDPKYAEFLKKRYESASKGNFDLYVVFVERGMQVLNSKGNLAYILPHKFFNAQYGEPLRGLLARGKHLTHIVHFGDEQVFPGSTNYVCLLFLRKSGIESFRFVKADDLSEWLKTTQGPEIEIPAKKIAATEWNFIVGKGSALLDRLLASRITLESITARIFQGIKTSADDIYIVEELERQKSRVRVYSRHNDIEYWLEPDLLHPLIKGGDSKRFKMGKTSLLILFPYAAENNEGASLISQDTLRKKLPLTWKYLTDHKKDLEAREHGKLASPQWYQYGRTQALDVMRVPKIFTPDISPSASFSFDPTGERFFTGGVAGGYGILVKPEYLPICILGLLNSRVLDWVIFQTATQFRGGYYSYEARFIRNLPIPQTSRDQQAFVATLGSYLVWLSELDLTENGARDRTLIAGYFEQLLNGLVYELFFPDELHAQKLFLFKYVEEAKLPLMSEIPEAKRLAVLRETFERIYDLNHPIRGCLFSLGALETVRIIEGEV